MKEFSLNESISRGTRSRSIIVDGNVNKITVLDMHNDGYILATASSVKRLIPTNPSLISDAASDLSCPLGSGRVIEVAYPAQSCSPSDTYAGNTVATTGLAGVIRPVGGTQFFCAFPRRALHAKLSYSFYVPEGFDFRRGGKLPGLSSADRTAAGGMNEDVGVKSFTCRHMWQQAGRFTTYFYMPDNTSRWGSVFGVHIGSAQHLTIVTGWNTVESEIVLNDVGKTNGYAKTVLNGVVSGERGDLVFRLNNTLHLEGIWFSTFFGGNTRSSGDNTYETLQDTYLRFSDLHAILY